MRRRRAGGGSQADAPSLEVRCICGRTIKGRPWLAGTDTAAVPGMFVVRWHRREDGLRCSEHGVAYLPDQSPEVLAAAAAIRRPPVTRPTYR